MEYVSFGEGVGSNHQRHKRPPLFSCESHPNKIDPHFHYRCTCRWQSGTSHKVGALLHNSIGGSRQTSLGKAPQLNWRPQVIHKPAKQPNRLGFQEPKSKKLLSFHPIKYSPRTQTDAPNAKARTQEVLKSFSPKFHQSYKILWGNKRRRTMEEIHKRLQDLDPKIFPSLRGEMDWWDCRSRSPLSNP